MFSIKKPYLSFLNFCKSWFEKPYKTIQVHENLPDSLKKNTLYLVIEDDFSEQAAMVCPCGCKNVLQMNLLPDERPCWKVTIHKDKTASLHPSVWRKKGCRSHFWFKRGKIDWC